MLCGLCGAKDRVCRVSMATPLPTLHLVAEPVAGTELESRENCGMYSAQNLFTITLECPHSVPVRKIRSQPCPQTRTCSLNHHMPPTHTSVPPRRPTQRAWNAGVGVPSAARRHPRSIHHAFHVPTAPISEQQPAAPLLRTLLHFERMHLSATAASFCYAHGKSLARRLIDHSGR